MNISRRLSSVSLPGRETLRAPAAFTLVEMLVVVAIIGLLISLLLPAVSKARQVATKTACAADMSQIGKAILMYRGDHGDRFPDARYMAEPFLSSSNAPSLVERLKPYVGNDTRVYHCPGDRDYVFVRSGISYVYNTSLIGQTAEENFLAQRMGIDPSNLPVSYDMDGGAFMLAGGGSVTVPTFHISRNLLFADCHVGNFK